MNIAWLGLSIFIVLVYDRLSAYRIPDKYIQFVVKVLVVYVAYEVLFSMIDIIIRIVFDQIG